MCAAPSRKEAVEARRSPAGPRAAFSASIPTLILHLPIDDEPEPELSIVIPALNEELTIADFVAWCRQGLAEAGVRGEVLIVDSSSDRTREIALSQGRAGAADAEARARARVHRRAPFHPRASGC